MSSRYSHRQRTKFGLITLIVLALIIMVMSVILVVKFPAEDIWEDDGLGILNPGRDGFSADPVESQMLYPFGDGILKVGRNTITFLNLSGEEIKGEAVSMQTPMVSFSDNHAIIVDTNGVSYILADTNQNIIFGNSTGTLDFGSINTLGYSVMLSDEAGVKGVARVFDSNHNLLFTWKSAQSGYILSANVSPDSKFVDMSIANTDGARMVPMLRRFSIEGEVIGHFVPQSEALLPQILYDTNQNPVLLGQTTITSFDGTNEKYILEFNKIFTATQSEYGIVIIAKENISDIPSLYLINDDGIKEKILELSEEVSSIATKGDYAAVGYGNTVVVANLKNSREISRNPISASVIRLGFSQRDDRVIVVARDGVTSFVIS